MLLINTIYMDIFGFAKPAILSLLEICDIQLFFYGIFGFHFLTLIENRYQILFFSIILMYFYYIYSIFTTPIYMFLNYEIFVIEQFAIMHQLLIHLILIIL